MRYQIDEYLKAAVAYATALYDLQVAAQSAGAFSMAFTMDNLRFNNPLRVRHERHRTWAAKPHAGGWRVFVGPHAESLRRAATDGPYATSVTDGYERFADQLVEWDGMVLFQVGNDTWIFDRARRVPLTLAQAVEADAGPDARM